MNTANYTRLTTNNMKRAIKFRAWDVEEKQMMDWSTMRQSAFNEGGVNVMYEVMVSRNTDYEIMQFTGLTDKNGKEIYEGDILARTTIPDRYVVFEDAAFRTEKINNKQLAYLTIDDFDVVIGNVHENPELIN